MTATLDLDAIKVSPTEQLMLEVLIARYRLGESHWTFDRNRTSIRAANQLAAKGLIVVMDGIVERSFRAYLSDAMEQYLEEHSYAITAPRQGFISVPVERLDKADASFDWKQGFTAGWITRQLAGGNE